MTLVPSGTVTSKPSMVRVTVASAPRRRGAEVAVVDPGKHEILHAAASLWLAVKSSGKWRSADITG